MYKALVIGCGNIGAQYDMHSLKVQSHVKAWHLNPLIDVSVYDINLALAEQIANLYACKIITSVDIEILKDFDCVSICTPTFTHVDFLEKSLTAGINTIICEKPVSIDGNELEYIKHKYAAGRSKVLVNYIRRFLPAFIELKQFINSIMAFEELTNINIRYQRGFINNCSHAFDLITFLMGKEIDLNNVHLFNLQSDHFKDDPTLSMQALWGNVNFNVHGLTNVCFSHFEIDIYFKHYKIIIKNAGDVIELYKSEIADHNLKPLKIQSEYTRTNCLNDYMIHVTDFAVKLMNDEVKDDNFIDSITLNQKMLNYIRN